MSKVETIASKCLNHKIATLIEEESDKESEGDVQGGFENLIEEEVMHTNKGEHLVIQRSLSVI